MRTAAVTKHGRRSTAAIGALGVSLTMAACGGGGEEAGSTQPAAGRDRPAGTSKTNRVSIIDFKYKPAHVEVRLGSMVAFVNDDKAAHTATSTGPRAFDTGSIMRGETKRVVPKEAGDFDYYCAFHPFMKAKIRVVK
jgi:plastocyanin